MKARFMRLAMVAALFAALFSGCSLWAPDSIDGDFFFLHNDDADMPVWVNGNRASGKMIVFLAGGPGDGAFFFHHNEAFVGLEKDFAVAYWDQRTSGNAQGNSGADRFTVAQFVEDLDMLVETLEAKYGSPRLYLMGHSWGGLLATAYLADSGRQSKIAGWINVDGSQEMAKGMELSRAWTIARARERLAAAAGEDEKATWRAMIEWETTAPVLTIDIIGKHYENVNKAGGYFADQAKSGYWVDVGLSMVLNSPLSLFGFLCNSGKTSAEFDMATLNLRTELGRITIPSLILWGEQDGILPVALAASAYDALGAADKAVVTFPNSAHSPMAEEPEAFRRAVKDFISARP